MIVTLKPMVFAHHRKQDGSIPVKIRITFKQKSKYLATTLTAYPQDLTRSLKIKSPALLSGCETIMQSIRQSLAKLSPFSLEDMSVDDIVQFVKDDQRKDTWRMDFFTYADTFIGKQTEGSRGNYRRAINALERYVGCRTLDINSITFQFIRDFQEYIDGERRVVRDKDGKRKESDKEKMKGSASVIYASALGTIYHSAQDKFNDEDRDLMLIPKDPFRRIAGTPKHGEGQPNLGLELMQRIVDAEPEDERQRYALDIFVLSFLLRGINVADLYELTDIQDGWIEYQRHKTRTRRDDRAYYRMRVPDEAMPYLERLRGRRRLLDLSDRWRSANTATHILNEWLRLWETENKTRDFTMYAVRHTYASVARNEAGLDKAMVDDLLGHKGDYDLADIYIEKDWEVLNTAHRKVLDLIRW